MFWHWNPIITRKRFRISGALSYPTMKKRNNTNEDKCTCLHSCRWTFLGTALHCCLESIKALHCCLKWIKAQHCCLESIEVLHCCLKRLKALYFCLKSKSFTFLPGKYKMWSCKIKRLETWGSQLLHHHHGSYNIMYLNSSGVGIDVKLPLSHYLGIFWHF